MRKLLLTIGLTFLCYLIQVCIMPELPVFSITGNILLACIAVIAIAYSPFFAYVAGAIAGILTETMLSPFDYLNLVLYPVLALLGAYALADKNERRLERERTMGKRGENISPFIRTPLCAALMAMVKEVVHSLYVYLSGAPITFVSITRVLVSIIYTLVMAAIIMIPMRSLLGIRLRKKNA